MPTPSPPSVDCRSCGPSRDYRHIPGQSADWAQWIGDEFHRIMWTKGLPDEYHRLMSSLGIWVLFADPDAVRLLASDVKTGWQQLVRAWLATIGPDGNVRRPGAAAQTPDGRRAEFKVLRGAFGDPHDARDGEA